MTLQPQGQLHL